MEENKNLGLRDDLERIDGEFTEAHRLFATSGLTFPGYLTSTRGCMFNAHTKQYKNLLHAEPPTVATGNENLFGDNSSGYKKVKGDGVVIGKVNKYSNKNNHSYLLFIKYDDGRVEVVERKSIEDLTERYAFMYNNENIDSKDVGDKLVKDEVLFKSNSYDDEMNYGYGRDVDIMYSNHNQTIEDGVMVSESFVREMCSIESFNCDLSINDNDVLLNLYGDSTNYKVFPNIGEPIKDKILTVKRRIVNKQKLFDMMDSELTNPDYMSDSFLFGEGIVTDITIYCNKELDDIPDTSFNKQLKEIVTDQRRYWQEIHDICVSIVTDDECKESSDINYLLKRSHDVLDPSTKFRDEANVFSNMIVQFTVSKIDYSFLGNKYTGRYGNKGVITRIVPDKEMPMRIDANGNEVHAKALLSRLGVIGRTNTFQLFEVSTNRISRLIIENKFPGKSINEKAQLVLEFYELFEPTKSHRFKNFWNTASDKRKEEFITSVEKWKRIRVELPILHEDETPIFLKVKKAYEQFKLPLYDDIYINFNGRKVKTMKPGIIDKMYMLKLKQTSEKGFSAVSLGGVSPENVPAKGKASKLHKEAYSKNPIREGQQETGNLTIGISPELLAQFNLLHRSSPMGRQKLAKALLNQRVVEDIQLGDREYNVNAKILQAYLKTKSRRLEFETDDSFPVIDKTLDTEMQDIKIMPNGHTGEFTEYEWAIYEIVHRVLNDHRYDEEFLLRGAYYRECIENTKEIFEHMYPNNEYTGIPANIRSLLAL